MITTHVTSQNWGEKKRSPLVKSVGMLNHAVNTINAAVEDSWTCVCPWNCLSIFFRCLVIFFESRFFLFHACWFLLCQQIWSSITFNRGASASWAKLQVGRSSKYFGIIQTLFLSLSSVLKGWASFFLSSFLFADMLFDMEIGITKLVGHLSILFRLT